VNRGYPTILDELGRGRPVELTSVAGGCIANARVASFSDGSSVFVKSAAGTSGMFEREAEGLRALAAAASIRVPEVLAVGREALVLEMIHEGPKQPKFFEAFGRGFAKLHDHRGPAFGFPHDNFIGSTPQRNDPIDGSWAAIVENGSPAKDGSTWPEFFLERRLRFQVKLATSKGHGPDIGHLLDRAEGQIAELLGSSIEPPGILHGDLWSGNYLVDDLGEACLIDPAVYYGNREADLAMTRLFGGFDSSFYEAYCEVSPLAAGHQERLPIYQLYHILNHLNLFGGSYYDQSLRILRRYSGC
jgi:fructosamine-3-kinase